MTTCHVEDARFRRQITSGRTERGARVDLTPLGDFLPRRPEASMGGFWGRARLVILPFIELAERTLDIDSVGDISKGGRFIPLLSRRSGGGWCGNGSRDRNGSYTQVGSARRVRRDLRIINFLRIGLAFRGAGVQ